MFSKLNKSESISKDEFLKLAAEIPNRATKKRKQETGQPKKVIEAKSSISKKKGATISTFGTKKDVIINLAKRNASESTKKILKILKIQ